MSRIGPLAWTQRSVWLDHHSLPPERRYECNVALKIDLPNGTDVAQVRSILAGLVSRCEVFRTTFPVEPRCGPSQVVHPSGSIHVDVIDAAEASTLESLASDFERYCFDLATEFPVRARIVRRNGTPTGLILLFHHIAVDATTCARLIADTERHLGSGVTRRPPLGDVLNPLDLAMRERSDAARRSAERALRYWTDTAGRIPTDAFPFHAQARGVGPAARNATLSSRIAYTAAKSLSRHYATPTSVIYQAAFAAVTAAGGRSVVSYKMLSANRRRATRDVVGCMMLPVVVCLDNVADSSFSELVRRTGGECMKAARSSYVPFDQALEAVARVAAERGTDLAMGPVVNCLSAPRDALPASEIGSLRWHKSRWEYLNDEVYFGAYHCRTFVTLELNARSTVLTASGIERFLLGVEYMLRHHAVHPDESRPIWQIGELPGFSWPREGRRGRAGTGVMRRTRPPASDDAVAALCAAVSEINGVRDVDPDLAYVPAGGRVLHLPEVLALLRHGGYRVPGLYDLLSVRSLRDIAGSMAYHSSAHGAAVSPPHIVETTWR